jgi:poly-gamma-glutamate capsule biosynthesis protein CapA/YwtB (metallophosphatase superfamily)
MIRKLLILFVIFLLPSTGSGQIPASDSNRISLLFIGDIMGHDEQIWSAEDRQTHTYSYDDVFQYIKKDISEADISIANLEVTLASPPYEGYPRFSSPASLAAACKSAGIDCFVTANNHSADQGKKGIDGTISRLDSLGILHTGTFADQKSRDTLYPLILEKKGKRFALLNYTFSTNGITVPAPCIVNMLDKELIVRDIARAKAKNPDAIILFLHWGNEYDTIPSKNQTELADFFLDQGADLIIGSHPHVLQRMEWIRGDSVRKERPVFYSLGNFVSNQRRPRTDGGAMVRVEMAPRNGSFSVTDAGYYLTWVYTPIINYRKKFYVLPCTEYENRKDFFANPADFQKMRSFIKWARSMLNKKNINVHELVVPGNDGLH